MASAVVASGLSVGSGRSLATLSLLKGIRTYLMTRALGAFGRMPSELASGGVGRGGWRHDDRCSHHTEDVVFNLLGHGHDGRCGAAVGALCTGSSLYSISYPVPLPMSLSVRLVIAEVELVQPGTLGTCDVPPRPLWACPSAPQSQKPTD